MGGPYKKKPKPRKDFQRTWKTKRRVRDIDEIDEDMKEKNACKLLHQEIDYDKPGAGQHYCLHCSRYFITKDAMLSHFRTKGHKRRLKDLELEPYTQAEAERAAGKGSFFEPKRRKVETQPIDDDNDKEVNKDVDITQPIDDDNDKEVNKDVGITQPIDDVNDKEVNKDVDITQPIDDDNDKEVNKDVDITQPIDDGNDKEVNKDVGITPPIDDDNDKEVNKDVDMT